MINRGILQTDAVNQRPTTRPVPIPPFSVDTGAAQEVFASPDGQTSALAGLVASNGTAAAITLTVDLGESAGSTAIDALTIPANSIVDLSGLLMLPPGGKLWAAASATGVKVSGWATVYL